MVATFWAIATFLSLIILSVCATSWYIALQQQREGSRVPYSRYWSAPAPKNQDMT